jgi:hypothetical protein
MTSGEIEDVRDRAKAFADEIEIHKGSRKVMPEGLTERFRSLIASLLRLFPDLKHWRLWGGLPGNEALTYDRAYKWGRKIEDLVAADSVRGSRRDLP